MRKPLFTADSASVTVLRSLASSAFGKYDLTIPEGMDEEDFYTFAAPDNELAYVASLVSERRVGGLARRFVRADVQVTAKDDTDPDWVAASTVDDVLEEAAERTSGDFFLESDISKAGLNGYEPFVDFTVGDKADVDVWGRYVTLPVTRIQPGVSEHDTSDFLVHLGGQIVSDTDARLAENEEIRRALVEDRRNLEGLSSKVSKAVDLASMAWGAASVAVVATGVEFAVSGSDSVAPVDGWSEDQPARGDGVWVWQRQVVEFGDGRVERSVPVLVTGAEGPQGAPGVSVSSVTRFWRWADTNPGTPTGTANPAGWSTTQPAYVVGQKLWTTTRTLLSNNTAQWAPTTEEASVSAATAISSQAANTKNRIWYSTTDPGATRGEQPGDTYYKYSGSEITGLWRWSGTEWVAETVGNQVVGNLDAGKITSGTIDAQRIGANTISAREIRAEVFTQVGSNLLPLEPGTVNPAWTANVYQSGTDNAVYQGFRWYSFDKTYTAKYTNMTQVDPSLEYDFTVWLKGDNNSKLYVELRDQDGKQAVASGGLTNTNPAAAQTSTRYLVDALTLPAAWTKYTTRIRLHPGVRAVRVGTIYWSRTSGPAGIAYIGDMALTQHQVPQAEIDAMQDEFAQETRTLAEENRTRVSQIEALMDDNAALTAALDERPVTSFLSVYNTVAQDKYLRVTRDPLIIEALGDWVGTVSYSAQLASTTETRWYDVPFNDGTRVLKTGVSCKWATVHYAVKPGVAKTESARILAQTVPQSTLTAVNFRKQDGATVSQIVFPKTQKVTLRATIRWKSIPPTGTYTAAIYAGSTVLARESKTNWGPFYGTRQQDMVLLKTGAVVPAGQPITVGVSSSNVSPDSRSVLESDFKLTWVET